MKFIVDAQLPRRLIFRFQEAGYDAIHTKDLPLKNKTSDLTIQEVSFREERIVVSKDADFVVSFTLFRKPYKLLLISTGNIRNKDLETLLQKNLSEIVSGFNQYDFIEMDRSSIIYHV